MNIEDDTLRSDAVVGSRERDSKTRGTCPACKKEVMGNQDRVKVMHVQKDKVCRSLAFNTVSSSILTLLQDAMPNDVLL